MLGKGQQQSAIEASAFQIDDLRVLVAHSAGMHPSNDNFQTDPASATEQQQQQQQQQTMQQPEANPLDVHQEAVQLQQNQHVGAVEDGVQQSDRKRSLDDTTNGSNLIKRPKRRNKSRKNYAAIDKGYSSGEDGQQVIHSKD